MPNTRRGLSATRLAGACLLLALLSACSQAAGASASLFLTPAGGKYPYHLSGSGGKAVFETVAGKQVKAEKVDALLRVLSEELFDLHLEFLNTTSEGGSKCSNTSNPETVLANLLGHFGTSDPSSGEAVLLLIPSGFEFTCELLGIKQKVKLRGSVIGSIAKPGENEASEELGILFKQTKGKQEFTSFLLGEGVLLTNQIEEASLGEAAFEQAGQQDELITLKASAGEGKFELDGSQVFRIAVKKTGALGEFTIENKAKGKSKIKSLTTFEFPVGLNEWEVEEPAKANCAAKTYEPAGMLNSTCTFGVKYKKGGNVSVMSALLEDQKKGKTSELVACNPENC